MCKPARKWLVAAVAVVLSLLAVNYFYPEAWTHLRLWFKDKQEEAQDSIPLEKKIAAAKLKLEDLAKEDDRAFQKVAEQIVAVQNLENEVKAGRDKLAKEESRIAARKASLDKAEKFVSYNGQKYEVEHFREELRAAAARFQTDELMVQSKDEQLTLRKKSLEISRKRLAERKLMRQKMKTEL